VFVAFAVGGRAEPLTRRSVTQPFLAASADPSRNDSSNATPVPVKLSPTLVLLPVVTMPASVPLPRARKSRDRPRTQCPGRTHGTGHIGAVMSWGRCQ
jgi:hypothetical protein